MATILDTIVATKREELAKRRGAISENELIERVKRADPVRGFAVGLAARAERGPAIIAEVKRGSPSLGCIRPDLDAADQAVAYQAGGAVALSVLTDEQYFFGSDADFAAVRSAVALPMLRKEFIIDPYQVYESRVLGADCVLIILSILSDDDARTLGGLAHELGMDVLMETHTAEEIARAQGLPHDLLGINNRNLNNFSTNESVTLGLLGDAAGEKPVVAESGLHSVDAISRNWAAGVRRFLIGEAFVRSDDPTGTVSAFCQAAVAETT